jgi:hypothetical protein
LFAFETRRKGTPMADGHYYEIVKVALFENIEKGDAAYNILVGSKVAGRAFALTCVSIVPYIGHDVKTFHFHRHEVKPCG